MNIATKIVLLVILFAVGYAGARVASRPPASKLRAEVSGERDNPAPTEAREKARHNGSKTGLAAAMTSLERVESAFRTGNFAGLQHGEWALEAGRAWAEADPAGLWEWLQFGNGSHFGSGIYGAIFSHWFRRDPDAALDALRKTRGSQWDGKSGMVALLFHDDPEVARAASEGIEEFLSDVHPSGDSGSGAFALGRESVEKLLALPECRARSELLGFAVAGWFRIDWKAAKDWAAARPAAERADMERGLFSWGLPGRLTRDPEGMVWVGEFLAREENRDLRAQFGSMLTAVMARQDPASAMTWAAEHLGPVARARAMGSIATTLMRKDPAAAMEMVDALPPGGVRRQAGRSLVLTMLQLDPAAAYARALSEQRAGFDLGYQEWGQVATMLAIKRPEEARQVLHAQPDTLPLVFEDRLLSHLASSHPRSTLEWAATELEGERRTAIMDRVLRSWRVHDRVAAEKWESGAGE